MSKDIDPSILRHFSSLSDPRGDNGRHKLIDIIEIAICGVIANADRFEYIAEFGRAKYEWLGRLLKTRIRQSGKARGDATSAAYSSICEHWRVSRNAEWRPQAQLFNSLLEGSRGFRLYRQHRP
ncbi:MAG: transposase family protein [Desulfobacterales bacterium]|nr:transposase family protein [Desulfobacterales bacterium]MDD3081752.1 transposase family protein [Desulfobacterales bacterium]MDD3950778.1 transposase family protein [Desulfobacterales bacterium]MDD4463249.1 transposase family protein [Desulfobacterales bacterium]